jgi:hypothetical protein
MLHKFFLLERDLGKAPELPRVQPFPFLRLELLQRLETDLEVLSDPLAVEFAGPPRAFSIHATRGQRGGRV